MIAQQLTYRMQRYAFELNHDNPIIEKEVPAKARTRLSLDRSWPAASSVRSALLEPWLVSRSTWCALAFLLGSLTELAR